MFAPTCEYVRRLRKLTMADRKERKRLKKIEKITESSKIKKEPSSVAYVPGGIASFLGGSGTSLSPASEGNTLDSFFSPSSTKQTNVTVKVSATKQWIHKKSQQSKEAEASEEAGEVTTPTPRQRKTRLKREAEGLSDAEEEEGMTRPKKKRALEPQDPLETQDSQEPSDPQVDSRTVFVGNLPLNINKKELKGLFKTYGKIESIRFRSMGVADLSVPRKVAAIKQDLNPKKTSFNAYIVFQAEECATAALECNGKVVNHHHLRVDIAGNDKKHDMKRSLFVGNLPFNIAEEDFRNHFAEFGTVEGVRLIRDKNTGVGKGFGYVLFEDSASVEFALKMGDTKLKGRQLRLKRAVKKEKQKPQGGAPKRRRKPTNGRTGKPTPRSSQGSSRSFKGHGRRTGKKTMKPHFKNKSKKKPMGSKPM